MEKSFSLLLKFGKIEKNAKDPMGIRTPTHVDTRIRGTRPRPLGHTENLTKVQPFLDNQFIVMTNDIVGCIKPPGFPMYISHCAVLNKEYGIFRRRAVIVVVVVIVVARFQLLHTFCAVII